MQLREFFRWIKGRKEFEEGKLEPEDIDRLEISDVPFENFASLEATDIFDFMEYCTDIRENQASIRRTKIVAIRAMYHYFCNITHKIQNNPAEEIVRPKLEKRLPAYLTTEESMKLLKSVPEINYERNYCIITFFLNLGLRLSELVGINMTEIKEDTLTVLGKGRKERMVYLNDACIDALNAYLAVRKTYNRISSSEKALFVSPKTGKRLTGRAVEKMVNQAFENAGLGGRRLSPHKLRHTFATQLYGAGADVLELKEILGHSSVATTQIYTHIEQENLKEAMKKSPLAEVRSDISSTQKASS